MPRPELLSPAQRAALMAPASDLNECIRYYTLSANDLHLIRQHRGVHNQLGLAVQLCYLRFPGRTLGVEEVPRPEIVGFVAAHLGLPVSAWSEYAKRDQTRREHLQELQRHSGLRLLTVDVIGPGDLCSRAATLKGYFYTNLGGTLNRQNRKFSVCRALGKRLGSRFYQERARAKNKNGNSFTTSLRMVTLELRYQLDQANWVSNGRICLKFTFLQ